MRTFIKIFMLAAAGMIAAACIGGAVPRGAGFGDIRGKEWKLAGLRTAAGDRGFSRRALEEEGFGDAFSLKFEGEQIRGAGAPNRYFAPYKLGDGQTLEIKGMAHTLMASFKEPAALKEAEYFALLEKAGRWALVEDRLELSTETPGGEPATLIFITGE
jgi:heat shock protein HslJ